MKLCPHCAKTYDDTWEVCLACGRPLVPSVAGGAQDAVGLDALRRLEERVIRIEQTLGMAQPLPVVERCAALAAPVVAEQTAPVARKDTGTDDIETRIGLVWLNRIGVLALFLGVVFFLKYAFDNQWIGELGRVVIGLLGGLALIVGGEAFRQKKYETISEGLTGGGVAILYVSIAVAYGLYHLIGVVPALFFLSGVTLFSGLWAVRTNWLSAALLGATGGFLTPIVIGLSKLPPVPLFVYLAILNVGVFLVSIYKKWHRLILLAFFFTQALYWNWYGAYYRTADLAVAALAGTFFFGLFCLLSITHNIRRQKSSDPFDLLLVIGNGGLFFAQIAVLLKPLPQTVPGLFPLLMGAVYLVFAYRALLRARGDYGLISTYAGLAVFFVTISFPMQVRQGSLVTIGWALESVLILWVGFRTRMRQIRFIGLLLGCVSLVKVLALDYGYSAEAYARYLFLVNPRMMTYAVIVLALFATARLYRTYRGSIEKEEALFSTALVIVANVVLLIQLSTEAHSYFAHIAHVRALAAVAADKTIALGALFSSQYRDFYSARELSVSLLWISYALMLICLGVFRRFRALRLMGLILSGCAVFKIFLVDLSSLDTFYRIISFISLGGVLILASFLYQKYRDRIREFALSE